MKIQVTIDITPEELRKSLGLPNLGPLQEQWLQGMADGVANSAERQSEFVSAMINGGLAPWRSLFNVFQADQGRTDDEDDNSSKRGGE